jgi:hypothetical protein
MSVPADGRCPACGRRQGLAQGWRLLIHHAREHRPPERLVCSGCGNANRLVELEPLRRECLISWLGIAFSLLLAAPLLIFNAAPWIHLAVSWYLFMVWLWCGLCVRRRLRLATYAPAAPTGVSHGHDD